MKRATPATKMYAKTFTEMTAAGWSIRNYGGGWRYFSRPIDDAATKDGMALHDVCRVSLTGTVEAMEPQYIR